MSIIAREISEIDRTDPDQLFGLLVNRVRDYMPELDESHLRKAYEFGAEKHKHQKRKSGEPYITHPLEVAIILTDLRIDLASLVAAILHDTVEDTDVTVEEISDHFGPVVAELVDGLTKISKIKFRSNQEKLAENFRKMIFAMAKDLRVIIVKLCDRLHNMRTLGSLANAKKQRIAKETLDIYAPLANRLGIYNVKSELEDLCLRSLKSEIYSDIKEKINSKKDQRRAYIDEVIDIIKNELRKYHFEEALVYGRPKHFYSIYKKMSDRGLAFEEINDLFAFRIVVENIKECYEILGIIHAMWKPMPGRFKDYIAMPKANMYQSLHTTVIRPNGEPAEIQIRTKDMHNICEFGVAAHWSYKEKGSSSDKNLEQFSWLRQIMQYQSELSDPNEFLEAVKVDLFEEEIFVFTPKGDVISLARGSTALDFAFAIHSEVGVKTIGAKVNGKMVPIKNIVKSGDIVEIITSPSQTPSKDWLNIVKTSKARSKIRSILRSEHRNSSKVVGEQALREAIELRSLDPDVVLNSKNIELLVKAGKESKLDDVYISIGYGKLDPIHLIDRVFPKSTSKSDEEQAKIIADAKEITHLKSDNSKKQKGVLISGFRNVLINFGKCCNPIPGEEIVGFITRGRGVTVHRESCPRAIDMDPHRKIDAQWSGVEKSNVHTAYLRVTTHDKSGVLADVTAVISGCGAGIKKAEIRVSKDLYGILDFELSISNIEQLDDLMNKLEGLPSVVSATRRSNIKLK